MSKQVKIGEITKLVVVGGGQVAALGTKGTLRFDWTFAHSRARVDEIGDVRLDALLRYGFRFGGGEDFAKMLPRGAVIPLPSKKRAENWMKRGSGPKQNSRWLFESAIEAGFKPRYYLGESENPYDSCGSAAYYWEMESVYLPLWINNIVLCHEFLDGIDEGERELLNKVPDWQTRVLVAAMAEDEYCNGDYMRFAQYILTEPLLSV